MQCRHKVAHTLSMLAIFLWQKTHQISVLTVGIAYKPKILNSIVWRIIGLNCPNLWLKRFLKRVLLHVNLIHINYFNYIYIILVSMIVNSIYNHYSIIISCKISLCLLLSIKLLIYNFLNKVGVVSVMHLLCQ